MLPIGLGYVEGVAHDYRRHGTTTLFAALDTARGTVLTQCRKRHRHQEYLEFLREIDQNVPSQLDVHVVVDNYATHKHPRVQRWLAARPRFHVHFTPTYASWLNQVEIWFNRITQQAIRRGTFRSVKELVEKIDQYVQNSNRHPHPLSGPRPQIRSLPKSSDYVNVFPGQDTSSRPSLSSRCRGPRIY
jgi:putative transposase